MAWQITKVVIAAIVISFTSWLAGKQTRLAGFVIALPISSMLALVLFQMEYQQPSQAVAFAKSIFGAVPLSLLFFVPFLLAEHLKWGFWGLYTLGVFLLAVGYLVHRTLIGA
jgi:hypothetical protein